MQKIKSRLWVAAVCAVFLALFLPRAGLSIAGDSPYPITDIFNLTERQHMAVTIYYDTIKPDVFFIAPNGSMFYESDLTVAEDVYAIAYYIPDAMAGQWRMGYDKKTNQNLDVNWAPYTHAIDIESFGFVNPFSRPHGTDISFLVTGETDGQYQYAIYAAIADETGGITGQVELITGYGRLNNPENVFADTSGLQTYGAYHFYLDVWREENGLESADSALSEETFAHTSPDAPPAIEEVSFKLDLSQNILNVDWVNAGVSADEYVLVVFDTDNESEPLYANSFTPDITSAALNYSPASSALRAELYYISRQETSAAFIKQIPLHPMVQIRFPEFTLTNQKQISVGYSTDRVIDAYIAVNLSEQAIKLTGTGDFSVALEDFDNTVTVRYTYDDPAISYMLTHQISVDAIAPLLSLPEHDTTLTVAESYFDLAGKTEPGATVTVETENAAVNADGTFIHRLTLHEGDNEFIINAKDASGNIASQLIVLRRAAQASETEEPLPLIRRFLPLILTALISCSLFALIAYLLKSYAKHRAISAAYGVLMLLKRVFLILLIASGLGAAWLLFKKITLGRTVNSSRLFDLVRDSVENAYHAIAEYGLISKYLLWVLAATGVLLVLFLICHLLTARIGRGKTPGKPQTRKKTAAQNPSDETAAEPLDTPILPEEAEMPCICPQCGTLFEKKVTFCSKCGTRI